MRLKLDIPDKYITTDTSPMYWISSAGNDCKIKPLLEENALSAIEDIKQEIEKQHTNTSGYGNDDFLYGKHQAYGNCLDIIDKHIDKEDKE